MPRGDAVQQQPTVADEMAKFSGFTVVDGETVDSSKEDLNPVAGKNVTDAEKVAIAANSKKETKPAETKTATTKLTDEESEAAIAAAEEKAGKDLTDAEVADVLKAATDAKNKPAEGDTKPKKTVQERINKSIKAQRAAERRADAAESKATSLEARIAALEAGGGKAPLTDDTKKEQGATDGAPDPKDFEFGELDTKYIRALARFEAAQEIESRQAKQEKTKLTAEQQKAAEDFEESVAVFTEAGNDKYEDFEEVVVQGARDKVWPMSDSLGMLLLDPECEFGIDIAYSLASDPKLAKEIFGKTASQQAAWVGRQQAKLSAGSGATTDEGKGKSEDESAKAGKVAVTKAPAPVSRARGHGSNSSTPGDTQDFAAFEAAAMGRTQ